LKLCKTLYKYWLQTDLIELKEIFLDHIQFTSNRNHKNDHFIIVDGSILHRLMLEKLIKKLQPAGLHYAYDGVRAVNIFKKLADAGQERIVVLITEDLPIMSGAKAAEMIRMHERKILGRTISYIIADIQEHNRNDEGMKVFNDFLSRPFEVSDLLGKLQRASDQLIQY
ncbi:MAG: hypothetical protein HQL32_08125, partial [Planctomycetes bacterium]|nr:hypothetical protein [Planctomycetota bacterium]